jgi:microcystin-dependent protein
MEIFAFGFAPKGWAPCDGRLLPIAQHQDLFSLLGTTFGGDGRTTFALPDLRSRAPIGQTQDAGRTSYPMGTMTGEESHTLTVDETPYHGHSALVVTAPDLTKNTPVPSSSVALSKAIATDSKGQPITIDLYVQDDFTKPLKKVPMAEAAIGSVGGQPHPNIMPYLTLNVCIALQGEMPKPGL